MDIRAAILAAAEHIERHPKAFRFVETRIPKGTDCGSPGCALGWIGCFLGMDPETRNFLHVPEVLGFEKFDRPDLNFYKRMAELDYLWQGNALHCARALRLYADRYHPAPQPVVVHEGIPQAVRDIFAEEPAPVLTERRIEGIAAELFDRGFPHSDIV